MTVFTERIELEDGVSDVARRAQGGMQSLADSLRGVMGGLVNVSNAAPGDSLARAATGADRYADSLARVGEVAAHLGGTIQMPAIAAAPAINAPSLSQPMAPAAMPRAQATAPMMGAPSIGPMPPLDIGPTLSGLAAASSAADTFRASLEKIPAAEHAIAGVPLTGLTDEMHGLQAAASGDGLTHASQSADRLGGSMSKLAAPIHETGQSMSTTFADAAHVAEVGSSTIGAAIGGIKSAVSSLAQGDVAGTFAGITDSIAGMAKLLDLAVPGLGQLVSVVVQIAGGIAGAFASVTVGAMKMAIEATQAKQALLSQFDALGEGKVTGEELDSMLDGLSASINIAKDDLVPLTKEFLKMGITGKDQLEKLTLAAISATAIVGQGGAAAFESLIAKTTLAAQTAGSITLDTKFLKQLKDSGLQVDDLSKAFPELGGNIKGATVDAKKLGEAMTDAVIKRGAGPLEQLGNTWAQISKRAKESFGDMFEDFGSLVTPLMKEVNSLFDAFGTKEQKATQAGMLLKDGIGSALKVIFETATKLVPMVKHFLLDVMILGLQAYIKIKPLVRAVQDFFSSATGSEVLSMAFKGIVTGLKVLGVVIVGVIAIAGLIAATFGAIVIATWSAVAAVASFASTLWGGLKSALSGTLDALTGWVAGAPQYALDFIAGLVGGITGGGGLVTDAVSNLATGAMDAFTGLLGIKSPSTVMAGYGRNMGEGLVVGTEDVAPNVHGAASDMASMAVDGANAGMQSTPSREGAASLAASSSSSTTNSTGGTVNIAPGAIVINGADRSWGDIEMEMVSWWERVAMGMGVA